MKRIYYYLKAKYHHHIRQDSWYITFASNDIKIGEIVTTTRGQKIQILSGPLDHCVTDNKCYFKYLVIYV
jgi:hypothetical protein